MNCGGVNFIPMEPSIRLHGAAMLTGRAPVSCRHPVKDDTKSGGTTAPQVNAEPSRQHDDWRQSAAADAPNTVDPSPASNTATNTSETRSDFATNPNEVMVPNASTKRPSFANGPRIVVALNASGITSVTYGGREHVAADNTDEVSENDATGRKSLVLENGVAGSGFVAEGDADGLTQRNASGHDNKPQLREFTAQYSGNGVSSHDCFALLYDAKLALRELTVDGTVRLCVYWALLLLLGLCGVVAEF
ncbi:hypothetical protein TCSYLVIO_007963 [Trypanosoma cruzi]|nr:hypothetical protein TCSYLVIO_007963 [Trypanosoma cruzi]